MAALKAIASFFAYIAALVAVVFLFVLIVGIFLSNNTTITEEYYAGCKSRSIEHRLSADDDRRFINLCMFSSGYRLLASDVCNNEMWTAGRASVPSCYIPKWMFWAEKSQIILF